MRISCILIAALLLGCEPVERPMPVAIGAKSLNGESASLDEATVDQPQHAAEPDPIRIIAWNVESGGSDISVIASQLSKFDHGIIALSEVTPRAFDAYAEVTGYQSVEGTTGRSDRLQILFSNRFELIRSEELNDINDGNHRSPLLVHLRDKTTGKDFLLNVNHLARGKAAVRESQADGLREWARNQTIPSISIGDFNFDYSFITKTGNPGLAAMLRDNVWLWVKPEEWIDTNWADGGRGNAGDGVDDYPDSMLDFAFVAGPACDWKPVCRVIERPGDFPDDETTSDHRPIELVLTPPFGGRE